MRWSGSTHIEEIRARSFGLGGDPSRVEIVATVTGERAEVQSADFAPMDAASAAAHLVDFLRQRDAERTERVALLERLHRERVRFNAAAVRVREHHHAHFTTLAPDEVEGWMVLAEVAEELRDLEAAPFAGISFVGAKPSAEALRVAIEACRRSRRALGALLARLRDLDQLLAERERSTVGRTLAEEIERLSEQAHRSQHLHDESVREAEEHALSAEPTTQPWAGPADASPASVIVRQPIVSNAPPSSDGPAHHLAAV